MHPAPRPPYLQPRALALVAAGGVLGALARYAVARLLPTSAGGLPVATLVTNRWSADPSSAPAPVRDYVEQQTRRSEPEQQQVDGAGGVTP